MKEQNRKIYSFDNFQLDACNRQLQCVIKSLALVENGVQLVKKESFSKASGTNSSSRDRI